MRIPDDILDPLNCALNESRLTQFSLDRELKKVTIVLETVAMNQDGTIPDDSRVVITFHNVCRLAGKLKHGIWNDESARIETLQPEELTERLRNFNGHTMYGWDFINVENSDKEFQKWEADASFDLELSDCKKDVNTIDIFSEHYSQKSKTLDLRVWFEELDFRSITGLPMTTKEFIDRGIRGWNAVYNGHKGMTKVSGIVAAGSDEKENNNTQQKGANQARHLHKTQGNLLLKFWSRLTKK
ncbi:hypothetical protein [Phaeocystidibacter luteus]|uniref:Uncharacterized protein n=1 Tax=Phaeocystidibacter luteus TaxID=911197 RepID=A0A6N6RFW3_9FLAO|nr:hypothetical protein [Phaeocystidibacter luteus]KAB2807696.1 hypothetical protein F8C67_11690 [Phaeocystidibacter luteus]